MVKTLRLLFILSVLLYSPLIHADTPIFTSEAKVQAGYGTNAPFWQSANQHGMSSINPYSGILRAGIFQAYDTTKNISYSYGAELYMTHDGRFSAGIQQCYAEGKFWMANVRVGMKEQRFGLHDSRLSLGDWGWSGNARPMPEISIGFFDFWSIPGLKNWLAIKGIITHAWFIQDGYMQNQVKEAGTTQYADGTMMHHKNVYLRIGDGKFPLSLTYGFEHYSQWGGVYHNRGQAQPQPSSFVDFLRVFAVQNGGADAGLGDQTNRLGDHLFSHNFQLEAKVSSYSFGARYQFHFDDYGGVTFDDFPDGTWGIYLRNSQKSWLTGAVFEYSRSFYQAGPIHRWQKAEEFNPGSTTSGDEDVNVGGCDNYYNNYSSWAHQGMTIGNPMISSPAYNRDGSMKMTNNRVMTFHFGMEGYLINDLSYRFLFTYMKGWGTYTNPYFVTKDSYSALLEFNYQPHQIKGWEFILSGGGDYGTLYGKNIGVNLAVRKTIPLFVKNISKNQ